MIQKFFRKIFFRPPQKAAIPANPALISVQSHHIRPEQISAAAVKICRTLQDNGFQAFIVGGAIRDLLIGHPPKDFDVATSATPEEVRTLFRRSRIIGRRFKIVHVLLGRETIEVSTFRAMRDTEDSALDDQGRVLRDNTYGTQAEDATRRDFTVNALYYDPVSEIIYDYHHGVADIRQKTLRMIGDPGVRYREDPVRMLRAVRLSAKLGLTLDPAAARPIRDMASLLENVPSARLFDEMLKLLLSGHALDCLRQLRDQGLHHGLLPLLDIILEQPEGKRFVTLALQKTDERIHAGKSVSPGYLFAALLWNEMLTQWKKYQTEGLYPYPALHAAMDHVFQTQGEKLAITRRFIGDIKEIWGLQLRFEKRTGKAPYTLISHQRFRAAWDFLVMRAEAGDIPAELPQWWNAFAHGDQQHRAELVKSAATSGPGGATLKKRRRRRSGRKTSEHSNSSSETPPEQSIR